MKIRTYLQLIQSNPVLGDKEIGWETDTNKYKIGDGVTTYNRLEYRKFNADHEIFLHLIKRLVEFLPTTNGDVQPSPGSDSVTALVESSVASLVASSPAALDTLNELATALGNDPSFATTMTNALAGKEPVFAKRKILDLGYKLGKFWKPNGIDVPGLQLWFMADDLPLTGTIAQWNDQSGNSRHATQAVAGQRPTVAAALLNEYAVADFGLDADDVLATAAIPALHESNATVYVVFKNDSSSSDTMMGQMETDSTKRRAWLHPKWTDGNLYADLGNINTGGRITVANSPFVGAGFHVLSMRREGAALGQIWRNGELLITDTTMDTPLAFTGNAPFYIGGEAALNNFEGEIAEIIVCNQSHTNEVRHKIEGYLSWKYNLQSGLISTHPYINEIPTPRNIRYGNTVALPTAGAGRVNVGTPVSLNEYDEEGNRIWYATVRGYFPNQLGAISNVNGVATGVLKNIGKGKLICYEAFINRTASGQTQLLRPSAGSDSSHLDFFYVAGLISATNKTIELYNDHVNADYNGAEFWALLKYTDSNNP